MEKLSSQDAGFLKLESPHCPFHVAGLMILKLPDDAPRNYMRRLVEKCGRLNELWPVFNKQLSEPENIGDAGWVAASDYVPERHVYHYALPAPGRMSDLMQLVTRAHERPLDRGRPLWEIHLIEGLPRDRFAIYCKVHHALVDGVGAMKMLQGLFCETPGGRLTFDNDLPLHRSHSHSLLARIGDMGQGLARQYRAIPELSRLMAHMGMDALRGKGDAMRLPFTSPRSLFNTELDSRRSLVICDLPLRQVKRIAAVAGGSVNDVLLAVCGGALRHYLQEHDALPRASLVAGMPVSLKSSDDDVGNKLSYIMCPFFTQEPDALKRLRRIIKVTSSAKKELNSVSVTAAEDFYALIMAPTILLTMTGNATRVRPATNAIFSNVPGSPRKLYLEGAELEALYPLSIVTDAMGLNITVVSHVNKLCFAIASCPRDQPGIESLGALIKSSYAEVRDAVGASA